MADAASTACPRCGHTELSGPTCPRCGVVLAKARDRRARPAPLAAERPRSSAVHWLSLAGVVAAGVVLGVYIKRAPAPNPRLALARSETARAVAIPADLPLPRVSAPRIELPNDMASAAAARPGLPAADHDKASALGERLRGGTRLASADVDAAEDLFSRYPDDSRFRDLLEATLMTAAVQEESRRDYAQSVAHLQRASTVRPDSAHPRRMLLQVDLEAGDWTAAEAAARAALQIDGRDAEALRGLGYALLKQDRSREAAEALQASLQIKDDWNTRGLLERIQKNLADERGMTQQHVSHFNVRYDGDAHDEVGREIVRALEHHYATLSGSLDYQPDSTIAVILFSREAYYEAANAPSWSGGVFDHLDGRIRIPIGGLTSSLTPTLDSVLIHELTHAFIHSRTRGVAPSVVHEGLAQYMEDKRMDGVLTPQMLTAFADGRIGGVRGFYLAALSFVEYLIANRGQGGMNDLLRVMGETGSVDEAFQQVYGQNFRDTSQAWVQRVQRQYGS